LAAAALPDTQYMANYLLPRGEARGFSVTVEFHGRSLENLNEILFYSPGISAAGFAPNTQAANGFKVKFQVAPDCPLSEHVLRVRTATALSDAVTFWVGPYPQSPEALTKLGKNDSMAKALGRCQEYDHCLGSHLARLELVEALIIITRRMPNPRPGGPA
jgi:hypothetical protein